MSLTAGEAMKGIDAATGPLLRWAQPSQYMGALRDVIFEGKNPLVSMLRGNSGIFPEQFAKEHPVASTLTNLGTDIYILGGPRNVGNFVENSARNVKNLGKATKITADVFRNSSNPFNWRNYKFLGD